MCAHAGGTWVKRIGGKNRHFGVWRDPEAALRKFLAFKDPRVMPPILRHMRGIKILDDLYGKTTIYFLSRSGEVTYVGQSQYLMQRISYHRTKLKTNFDAVAYIEVSADRADHIEAALIRIFNPRDNDRREVGSMTYEIATAIAADYLPDDLIPALPSD